ncbi:unnamed protein product [Clonostachys rosea f. rosea IK726]|uniref:Uncharacterized protein n=1 Tax=Clonostachys rosea f. rosea IK726 TaxID=1349383 RepID=A0ACA9TFA7_BIOOC|nr:unnamed protein product [Clonostachys rosea f. rosea IK726]
MPVRYGRNDFEKFCQKAARGSNLSIGSHSIGKIDIDCKYRWKRSQWGVLGRSDPAGIMYMDITFHQPAGYSLERANVYVTLSEDPESYALRKDSGHSRTRRREQSLDAACAVQFTDHYGPRYLTGAKSTRTEAKSNKIIPTLGMMGFELGGVGHETTVSRELTDRWVFKGLVRKPRTGPGYRTLEWELSGNSLDATQDHRQEYHTAFAFEHSQRPVFMRVEIDGKLRDRGSKLKYSMIKFSSNLTKQDLSTLTRIDLTGLPSTKRLDQIAHGLNMDMQRENYIDCPVELPSPKTANFFSEPLPQPVSAQSAPGLIASNVNPMGAILDLDDDELLKLQLGKPAGQIENKPNNAITEEDNCSDITEAQQDLSESMASTLVNTEIKARPVLTNDAAAELLTIPAVLSVLKVLAIVLQWWSLFSVRAEASSQSNPTFQAVEGRDEETKFIEDEEEPVNAKSPRSRDSNKRQGVAM